MIWAPKNLSFWQVLTIIEISDRPPWHHCNSRLRPLMSFYCKMAWKKIFRWKENLLQNFQRFSFITLILLILPDKLLRQTYRQFNLLHLINSWYSAKTLCIPFSKMATGGQEWGPHKLELKLILTPATYKKKMSPLRNATFQWTILHKTLLRRVLTSRLSGPLLQLSLLQNWITKSARRVIVCAALSHTAIGQI